MDTLMVFMAMLLIAVLSEPLAKLLRIPFTALLVLIGFMGSELLVAGGVDTGLRWQQFNHLILHVFVPVLVFESAFNMKARILLKNLLPVLLLAIPAMLLAAGITGAAVYYGIGHPTGFPWAAALLCGVIVSATDPVAVVALFKKLGAPDRLTALLEGESLFNDATAVVMFTLLVAATTTPGQDIDIVSATQTFLYTFLGGLVVGALCGIAGAGLYRFFNTPVLHAVITVISACSAFYIAEHALHVSGIVAVLLAGLLMGEHHRQKAVVQDAFTPELWEFFSYCCNALLFLLVGVTITWHMFESHWLAMIIGIAAATLARVFVVYGVLPAGMYLFPGERIPGNYRPVMMWGGLRGAVSLALALSLPTTLEGWYSVQSIAYGVVLFTLFLQAPFMPPLVRKVL
jgi:Na+:H+ antiporter